MNKFSAFFGRRRGVLVLLGVGFALLAAPRGWAQSPSQNPQPAPSTSPSTTPAAQTEAQKKAAERKRRFEEQKALLDGGGSASAGTAAAATHQAAADSEFYMNPIAVNMVANESQELHVWDRRGGGNDVSARVSWNLSGAGVVDMTVQHYARITAKMPGTVSVVGTIDGHTVEAVVTVYRGTKLPDGVPPAVAAPPPVRTGGRRNTMTVITNPD